MQTHHDHATHYVNEHTASTQHTPRARQNVHTSTRVCFCRIHARRARAFADAFRTSRGAFVAGSTFRRLGRAQTEQQTVSQKKQFARVRLQAAQCASLGAAVSFLGDLVCLSGRER